jgi:hypothetical protein
MPGNDDSKLAALDHELPLLAKRLDLAEEVSLTALGGGYFSSLGITTERVYPFIADARNLPRNIMESLVFCRLTDVLAAPHRITDGHLLIAASRAGHLFAGTSGG